MMPRSLVKYLKSPWAYLFFGMLPLLPIWSLFLEKQISVGLFLILSLVYMLAYRPIWDLYRLRALGVNEEFTLLQIMFVIWFKHYRILHAKKAE